MEMIWANKLVHEPPKEAYILVWDKDAEIVVSCYYSISKGRIWINVVSRLEINFDYWMLAPPKPMDG